MRIALCGSTKGFPVAVGLVDFSPISKSTNKADGIDITDELSIRQKGSQAIKKARMKLRGVFKNGTQKVKRQSPTSTMIGFG
jgi:hypothetical protein